jgi:hypothetical protein
MPLLMPIGTIVCFALVGLLCYARPGELMWLLGSLLLEILYFVAFWWHVTRPK